MNYELSKSKSIPWLMILILILVNLLTSACRAEAKVYRVGVLSGLDVFLPTWHGFQSKMKELGYVEGENIIYEVQKTNFDHIKYQKILHKFVEHEVDLIFVYPTEAALEAKAVTQNTDIPVLFSNANIEGIGLVDSIREPGGNITGVRYPGPDMSAKRLEIMLQLAPQAKRIFIPYQRGYPIVDAQLKAVYQIAQGTDITVIEAPVNNIAELKSQLEAQATTDDIGIDAIMLIDEPFMGGGGIAVVAEFAAEHKIPVGGTHVSAYDYKPIFGVTIDGVEVGSQAAILADKILRGIKAGTIPVVSAESYLYLNYKVAQALGLSMSDGLLSQAKEIIR